MLVRDVDLQSHKELGLVDKSKQKRKKVSFSSNLTASLGGEDTELSDQALKKRVTHHACIRLQIMALVSAVCQVTEYAARPELSPTIHQGGSSSYAGYSAAHSNLTPHLNSNARSACINKIYSHGLKYVDRLVLKVKGADDKAIEKISKGILKKEDLKTLVETFWKEESLFAHSYLERRVMSICHQLPHEVNSEIDFRLENSLRESTVQLYGDVSEGKLTAYQATNSIALEIQKQLSLYIYDAQLRINQLRKFKKFERKTLGIIKFCQNKTYLNRKVEKCFLHNVKRWRMASELCLQKRKGAPPAYLNHSIQAYESILNLSENLNEKTSKKAKSKFIRESIDSLEKVESIKSYMKEVDENINWFKCFILCCESQKKGSQYGPQNYINQFGSLDKELGKRIELTGKALAKEVIWSLQHFTKLDD